MATLIHIVTHREQKKGPPITCSVMCYYFCYTMGSKLFRICTDFFIQTISRKFFKTSDLVYLPQRIQQVLKHKFEQKFFVFFVYLLSVFYRKFVNGQYSYSFGIGCLLDMASKIIEIKSRTFLVKL